MLELRGGGLVDLEGGDEVVEAEAAAEDCFLPFFLPREPRVRDFEGVCLVSAILEQKKTGREEGRILGGAGARTGRYRAGQPLPGRDLHEDCRNRCLHGEYCRKDGSRASIYKD